MRDWTPKTFRDLKAEVRYLWGVGQFSRLYPEVQDPEQQLAYLLNIVNKGRSETSVSRLTPEAIEELSKKVQKEGFSAENEYGVHVLTPEALTKLLDKAMLEYIYGEPKATKKAAKAVPKRKPSGSDRTQRHPSQKVEIEERAKKSAAIAGKLKETLKVTKAEAAALPPEAYMALAINTPELSQRYDDYGDLKNALREVTGLSDDEIRNANTFLKRFDFMIFDNSDGYRLWLSKRGREYLDDEIKKVREETPPLREKAA